MRARRIEHGLISFMSAVVTGVAVASTIEGKMGLAVGCAVIAAFAYLTLGQSALCIWAAIEAERSRGEE